MRKPGKASARKAWTFSHFLDHLVSLPPNHMNHLPDHVHHLLDNLYMSWSVWNFSFVSDQRVLHIEHVCNYVLTLNRHFRRWAIDVHFEYQPTLLLCFFGFQWGPDKGGSGGGFHNKVTKVGATSSCHINRTREKRTNQFVKELCWRIRELDQMSVSWLVDWGERLRGFGGIN